MSTIRRTALWIVRTACTPRHIEEIEGDLLELHERQRCEPDRKSSQWRLLPQAIRAVLGRPSILLRRLAFAMTGAGGAVVAYVALVFSQPERSWTLWLIGLGVAVEVFFWILIFLVLRDRAGQTA